MCNWLLSPLKRKSLDSQPIGYTYYAAFEAIFLQLVLYITLKPPMQRATPDMVSGCMLALGTDKMYFTATVQATGLNPHNEPVTL